MPAEKQPGLIQYYQIVKSVCIMLPKY